MTKVVYPVKEFVTPEKAEADMATNYADLNSEFVRQAGLVYEYSTYFAGAEKQHSGYKMALEMKEAEVATLVREDAEASGKKLTADAVKEKVRLDPGVIALEKAVIRAKEIETVMKGALQALRDKRDSLTSLGIMSRDEMNARLALSGDVRADRDEAVIARGRALKERLAS